MQSSPSRRLRWTVRVIAAVAVASGSAAVGPSSIAAAATPSAASPKVTAAQPLAAVSGSHEVTLVLDSGAGVGGSTKIAALARQQLSSNPAARASQVAARDLQIGNLAPTTPQFDAVAAFAATNGLSVRNATRWTVTLVGDPTKLAAAFGVATQKVSYRALAASPEAAKVTGLKHTGTLAVPAALASVATSAVGLDDRPVASPRTVPLGPGGNTGPSYAAHLGGEPYVGATGAGVGVAITSYDPGGLNLDDYNTYLGAAGLHSPTPIDAQAVAGVTPFGTTTQEDIEGNLDVESLAAAAPSAQAYVYGTDQSAADEVTMFSKIADDVTAGKIQVVSSSFGNCESAYGSAQIQADDAQLARIVAGGATMYAAAGDAGAYDCSTAASPSAALAVDFPGSDPSVVSVGGTDTVSSGSGDPAGSPDTAWSDPTDTSYAPAGSGGGGGYSLAFSTPTYQAGKPGIVGTTRNVPDISAPADPTNGFEMYAHFSTAPGASSTYGIVGGTSLAAPLTAGYTADALSLNNRSGLPPAAGFGDIHGLIYDNQATFTDVTAGNNLFYPAKPGYDVASGIGTLNLPSFTNLLLGAPFADPTLTAPTITNNATINISSASSSDRHFIGYRVTAGADDCTTSPALGGTVPAAITLPAAGNNTITLVAQDELGSCHVSTVTVDYEPSYNPAPRSNPAPAPMPIPTASAATPVNNSTPAPMSGDHQAPTIVDGIHHLANSQLAKAFFAVTDVSGVASFTGRVTNTDTGHVVLTVHEPGLYLFNASRGHYVASALATDTVGNTSSVVTGVGGANPGVDDRQMRKTGAWIEVRYRHTLDSTVSVSRTKGSTLTAYNYVVGKHPEQVVVLSQGGGGRVQVLVDGHDFGIPVTMGRTAAIELPQHLKPGHHNITLKLVSGVAVVDGIVVR